MIIYYEIQLRFSAVSSLVVVRKHPVVISPYESPANASPAVYSADKRRRYCRASWGGEML